MPITFPDGTRMRVLYPPSLGLAQYGISPNTYGSMPGTSCGRNLLIRAFDAKGEIFGGEEPVSAFDTAAGGRAELWPGKERWPGHWLVFQFGHWQVLVNCSVSLERAVEGAEAWAAALEGQETSDGFLVLSGRNPLMLAERGNHRGPQLYIEGPSERTLLVLTPTVRCVSSQPDREEGFVEWCVEGASSALIVSAFGDDVDFIDSVMDGLRVQGG